MAVSSLSRGRAVDDDARAKESRSDLSNNNTSASKRVTPFSIDDILSKCDSVSALPETSVASNPAADQCTAKIDSICNQCLGPGGGLHLWKSDIYAMWLENFNRLYAASALQPFLMTTGPSPIAASDRLNRLLGGDSSNLTSSNRTLDYLISKSRSRICPRSRSVARQSNSRNLSSGSVPNKEAAGAVVSENGDHTPVSAKTNYGVVDADERARRGCDGDAKPPERESVSESPLDALERLACATFKGMEEKQSTLHAVAIGRQMRVKRRKCRTAFTSFQLSVLEQRFCRHKYLTPADRDQIAQALGLTAPQVITWFQNRRAKLKRDLEEMRNDLKTVQKRR